MLLHGKKELKLQLEWRLLIEWPKNKIILVAWVGQYNHKGSLNVEEGGRRFIVRVMWCEKIQPSIADFVDGRGHEAENVGNLQKLQKARQQILT